MPQSEDDRRAADTAYYLQQLQAFRQQEATFEQQREQDRRWFNLRVTLTVSSIFLFSAVMAVSSLIILTPTGRPTAIVTAASGAFFVNILGVLISVWKLVFDNKFHSRLAPVTQQASRPPQAQAARQRPAQAARLNSEPAESLPADQAALSQPPSGGASPA